MDLSKITDKEIQFNIMMALMKIDASLAELVNRGEECVYDVATEVNVDDTSGLNK